MHADYNSVFDIIGPVMVGPSSSHTAGAARIGRIARAIFGQQPTEATIYLYGSFAQTYRGHHTDCALVGGLLEMLPQDRRLPKALSVAKQMELAVTFIPTAEPVAHPNTAKLVLKNGTQHTTVTGISIGGGNIKIIGIDDFTVDCALTTPTILIQHQDVPGVIAAVTQVISTQAVNISTMTVDRQRAGGTAFMIIEVDQAPEPTMVARLQALPHVTRARILPTVH